ncbi:MAG: flagellar filament capping protein FliD [Opitutales bacterium]
MQLGGLASGLDTQLIVDQLMAIERVPQDLKRTEISSLDREKSTLNEFQTKLKNLQSAVDDLNENDLYFGRTAKSLTDAEFAKLTATASDKTVTGTYAFSVTQLATESSVFGTSNIGTDISAASVLSTLNVSTPITEGTITVNGAQIEVDPSKTLQELIDDIEAATLTEGNPVEVSISNDRLRITAMDGNPPTANDALPVSIGSAGDESNFLAVMKLFTNESGYAESASPVGVVNINAAVNSAFSGLSSPPAGAGSFMVNGVEINFDPESDSILSVMNRINDSTAGVRISYDSANDRFSLVNKKTGSLDIDVDDNDSGFLTSLGLTGQSVTYGENAVFSVNGGSSLTSSSNTFDSSVHGISGLSVTASDLTTGTEKIEVKPDTEDSREKVDAFIAAYNDFVAFVDVNTDITVDGDEVTSGVLAGNREITSMRDSIRRSMFQAVDSLTGDIKRLADIGVDFAADGSANLEVKDAEKLADALRDSGEQVAIIFTDSDQGLASGLDELIEGFLDDSGAVETRLDSIESQQRRLNDQIDQLERQLEIKRDQLEIAFQRMEEAQSTMNNQLQILNSSLG